MTDKWIYWFDELDKDAGDLVGKKAANLGEMTRAGLPVPPGFALSLEAYRRFMRETGVVGMIKTYLAGISEADLIRDERLSRRVRVIVESQPMPAAMRAEIASAYKGLCDLVGVRDLPVAVRSSGTVSMPGQMESHLNVRGAADVCKKVVQVWGSSFTHQALAYRAHKKMPIESFPIGVAVMKVVNAKCSGVAFSIHPNTGDRNKMLIEGNWGLGEGVVGGGVTPDRFVVDRASGAIEATINTKHQCVMPNGAGTGWQPVPPELQDFPCVTDEEVREIVKLAERLESAYGEPQDIEWVFDQDFELPASLRVVQTRTAKVAKGTDDGSQNQYLIDLMLNAVFHRR